VNRKGLPAQLTEAKLDAVPRIYHGYTYCQKRRLVARGDGIAVLLSDCSDLAIANREHSSACARPANDARVMPSGRNIKGQDALCKKVSDEFHESTFQSHAAPAQWQHFEPDQELGKACSRKEERFSNLAVQPGNYPGIGLRP